VQQLRVLTFMFSKMGKKYEKIFLMFRRSRFEIILFETFVRNIARNE